MLKVRVIPTLLWKDLGLVKGVGFNSWRRVGAVLPSVKVYNQREVDELVIVDITASVEQGELDHEALNDFADECFVPLTVGGGVSGVEEMRKLLRSGADKVSVNSTAYDDPSIVAKGAAEFGTQCIVASIDVRRHADGNLECFSHSGTRPTGRRPDEWASQMEHQGAGEILLTSIDRDGTMQGYDIALVRSVANAVRIPVIASGGCGHYGHMLEAVRDGGASAVAAASIFHFTQQTPREAKQALAQAGIAVRNSFVER